MGDMPGVYGPRDNAGSVFDGEVEVSHYCETCGFDGDTTATREGNILRVYCPGCDDWEEVDE